MKHKLVIERAKWLRGSGDSMMLMPAAGYSEGSAGKMCCLGFAAIQLAGLEPRDIEGDYNPNAEMCHGTPMEPFCHYAHDYDPGSIAMRVNDDVNMPEEKREEHLTRLFAQHDIEVEFI